MYIIGPISLLKLEFPKHDFTHARLSIPGDEVVIEEEISFIQKDRLEENNVFCLDHEDAIDYLNDPDMVGIWFPEEGAQQ